MATPVYVAYSPAHTYPVAYQRTAMLTPDLLYNLWHQHSFDDLQLVLAANHLPLTTTKLIATTTLCGQNLLAMRIPHRLSLMCQVQQAEREKLQQRQAIVDLEERMQRLEATAPPPVPPPEPAPEEPPPEAPEEAPAPEPSAAPAPSAAPSSHKSGGSKAASAPPPSAPASAPPPPASAPPPSAPPPSAPPSAAPASSAPPSVASSRKSGSSRAPSVPPSAASSRKTGGSGGGTVPSTVAPSEAAASEKPASSAACMVKCHSCKAYFKKSRSHTHAETCCAQGTLKHADAELKAGHDSLIRELAKGSTCPEHVLHLCKNSPHIVVDDCAALEKALDWLKNPDAGVDIELKVRKEAYIATRHHRSGKSKMGSTSSSKKEKTGSSKASSAL